MDMMKMSGLFNHVKKIKPWGWFEQFTLNEPATVKILYVAEGECISLQRHQQRSEHWRVLSGRGVVIVDNKEKEATEGDYFFVPLNTKHRITGGPGGIKILEVVLDHFDEADNERLEDKYDRAGTTTV